MAVREYVEKKRRAQGRTSPEDAYTRRLPVDAPAGPGVCAREEVYGRLAPSLGGKVLAKITAYDIRGVYAAQQSVTAPGNLLHADVAYGSALARWSSFPTIR